MKYHRIGFTGTRHGMTKQQKVVVSGLLARFRPVVVNHGDCVGADAEFHDLAVLHGARIVIHPPLSSRFRAMCPAHEWAEPKPYLIRDKAIVEESEAMIAAPLGYVEERRSGTWATVRIARTLRVPCYIVYPDGLTSTELNEEVET